MKPSTTLSAPAKIRILLLFTVASLASLILIPAVPQNTAYHHFADTRTLWHIPNVANVLSNAPFVLVALTGLVALRMMSVPRGVFIPYATLFIAIGLTALGSAYYHWHPTTDRLVFDRLPMTLLFMTLLSIIIAELVTVRAGLTLFLPLLLLGIASILWWQHTERQGHGDLRLYGFVQFYPMICIPLLIGLFYTPTLNRPLLALAWMVGWYALAKICESFDAAIYSAIDISGHTLKHLFSAAACTCLIAFMKRMHPTPLVRIDD